MTAEQTIAALRARIRASAELLNAKIDPNSTVDMIGRMQNAITHLEAAETEISAPSDPCQRFATADFYAGAIDALDYMIKVAEGTHGSEVWRTCFSTSRQNLTVAAQQKGFNIK